MLQEGTQPYGSLLRDKNGAFYGTNKSGGSKGHRNVLKLDSAGSLTVLHTFGKDVAFDGATPEGNLIGDALGNFYGTTLYGGQYGEGTLFKLDSAVPSSIISRGRAVNIPQGVSCGTHWATCMARPLREALGMERYSSWIRTALKLCFTL
jgi:uncharacterized repeat protein (TIGR03803 family)